MLYEMYYIEQLWVIIGFDARTLRLQLFLFLSVHMWYPCRFFVCLSVLLYILVNEIFKFYTILYDWFYVDFMLCQ